MSKLETKQELLQIICDQCHWCHVCCQEELDQKCDECMVSELVEKLSGGNEE